MFCRKCGNELNDGETVCAACGASVRKQGSAAPVHPVPAVPDEEPLPVPPPSVYPVPPELMPQGYAYPSPYPPPYPYAQPAQPRERASLPVRMLMIFFWLIVLVLCAEMLLGPLFEGAVLKERFYGDSDSSQQSEVRRQPEFETYSLLTPAMGVLLRQDMEHEAEELGDYRRPPFPNPCIPSFILSVMELDSAAEWGRLSDFDYACVFGGVILYGASLISAAVTLLLVLFFIVFAFEDSRRRDYRRIWKKLRGVCIGMFVTKLLAMLCIAAEMIGTMDSVDRYCSVYGIRPGFFMYYPMPSALIVLGVLLILIIAFCAVIRRTDPERDAYEYY